ncbi:hypothetical protein SAMN04488065_1564 [Haloplanus vescus]|uniref:Uncharacterized protein n=1 Tax=Haloplanus vescus TaxID=555874 RepID=A0A1H3XJA1_9EURY|nr:hypothetical protein [Haloplanus vescus]SDZ98628.1 hypothetical protein SAMN04488065_1564 [Haloplanus vescus]
MTGEAPTGPDTFPTEEELPDEPVTVDDIDPFDIDDDDFEDINDFATAEWKTDTTADERIRTVISRTTTPKSAREISDIAVVSESKARTTLNKLADEGTVRSHQTDAGTVYERDPDWYLLKQISQLSASETLVDQIQRVKQELADYKDKYGATTPEELLVSDKDLSQDELEDMSHWRTAEQEFNYLRAAYRLKEAKERTYTGTERGERHRVEQTTDYALNQTPR